MFNPQSFTETTLSKTNSKSFWKMVCWKTMFFLGFDPIFNVFLLLVLGNGPSFFMKHSEDWNFDDIRNCDEIGGIKTSAGQWSKPWLCVDFVAYTGFYYPIIYPLYPKSRNPGDLLIFLHQKRDSNYYSIIYPNTQWCMAYNLPTFGCILW